jgi:tetratricopeptide (TPR) repeat protein
MKQVLLFIFLIFTTISAVSGSVTDSLLKCLDSELAREEFYVRAKIGEIDVLKDRLKNEDHDPVAQYLLYESIFEGYKSFNYDSAFNYISRLQKIAHELNDPSKINSAKIKLGFIFLSSGMFKEAFDSLTTVKASALPDNLRNEYYSVMAILFYGLSDLQDRYYAPIYEKKAHLYVDSVLLFSPPGSYNFLYYRGLRHVRKYEFDEGLTDLGILMKMDTLSLHRKAIISSTMSDIYINKGNTEKSIELLAEASIFDIKTATKETAAILNLANILFRQGDIKRAYTYTKRALEDANFYGAMHRKIQVGSILPIIEEEKINTIEGQKRMLMMYSMVVTVLSVFIVLFVFIILRQLKKLKKADKEILETNKVLLITNQKMLEANKIKEEYIGYYFNINSNYIDKIENLKKAIEKSLATNKFDNARSIVSNIDLKKERISLYRGFDKVFLKLFPDFVKDFNALFAGEDQIILADNELLNTDLRIFALIRMGISENDKIAKILGFSVNTIYTYKTRIKNKSIVPNDEFEKRIMEIKFI